MELLIGQSDPLTSGGFGPKTAESVGVGSCSAYRREGDRQKVLQVVLTANASPDRVKDGLASGGTPLPEMLPNSTGFYRKTEESLGYAMLVRGEKMLAIAQLAPVQGRDGVADVLALMKLIAPRMLSASSSPVSEGS
ncbi:hypothetical protein Ssi02_29900 [Sinosporangium siamense]|uniref:Uncharacterized protein n=1 Tax=Sinosporangium siamense TaxID=1367973 RepID=A0A919RI13_9ACTN|nr:hypothetical protein Ssi02_29900 [Sinosporangium siamense]